VATPIRDQNLQAIVEVVRRHPEGMTRRQIAEALEPPPPPRTLQHRIKRLVDSRHLVMEGAVRSARYRMPGAQPDASAQGTTGERKPELLLPLSEAGREIRTYIDRPLHTRTPVGYDRTFLEAYRPNDTAYLSASQRAHLRQVGTPELPAQPAGTYAKRLLNRLLIDLSWNSSRLEGNTYSLLDTKRLIDLGEEAEGKERLEAQMILNHKDALEFLVGAADEIGFNRYTILNLHALLANNLLPDPASAGRLRHIGVGIQGSVFHPLEVSQLIDESFHDLLAKASAIHDPFEQSFFVMVQLPYLQPFDDVNKRVSRLAANMPFIKGNYSPLSFAEVPREAYAEAVLGVYELRRVELLRDVFTWAYERSAARYAAVRQSLGEPDPFRLRHRETLREIVGAVIRARMDKKHATVHIHQWTREHIEPPDRERFQEAVEGELLNLHEGNFARYRVRPSEFEAWRRVWNG
jgi:hypothetical protein